MRVLLVTLAVFLSAVSASAADLRYPDDATLRGPVRR